MRELLSHQAGLNRVQRSFEPGDIWRWEAICDALAAQEPNWQPGTAHGYHTLTFGHLAGELVRRIDGRDIATYIQQEITGPLGVDFLMGFDASHDDRVADLALPPIDTVL